MKRLFFAVISTVMISGLLLGSMGTVVFAGVAKDNPADPAVCSKENHKGNAQNKNPHCNQTPDTDGDGLTDEFEQNYISPTKGGNCLNINEKDTDDDGVEDGQEIINETDPCDITSV